jgi:PTS system fructose-specific IIA component/PTS system nitrogen regulatory IIA component
MAVIQFRDFIAKTAVLDNVDSADKNSALIEMIDALVTSGQIREEARKGIVTALLNREKLGSTGIGQGVAIPHAKHPSIKKIIGLFARSREGVEFDALDGQPVHLFFLLLSNHDSATNHLECLAYISKHLRDENFCRFLLNARDTNEIVELLAEADDKAMAE